MGRDANRRWPGLRRARTAGKMEAAEQPTSVPERQVIALIEAPRGILVASEIARFSEAVCRRSTRRGPDSPQSRAFIRRKLPCAGGLPSFRAEAGAWAKHPSCHSIRTAQRRPMIEGKGS